MKDQDFISLLQEQARKQSQLNENRLLPRKMDGLTSFVGNHSWQVILVLALVGSLLWQAWF